MKTDPLVRYDALGASVTRQGLVALTHVRLDLVTRRVIPTSLDGYILEDGVLPSSQLLLRDALKLYLDRNPEAEQLRLW